MCNLKCNLFAWGFFGLEKHKGLENIPQCDSFYGICAALHLIKWIDIDACGI